MRIPSAVTVGHLTYAITVERLDDLFGDTDHFTSTIRIHDGLAPQVERATVLHEIMHAVAHAAGNVFPRGGEDPSEDEENLIRMWVGPMLSMFQANPEVLTYLSGDIAGPSVLDAVRWGIRDPRESVVEIGAPAT